MIVHTADHQFMNGLVGGLRFGASVNILTDADLAAVQAGEGSSEEGGDYTLSLAGAIAGVTAKGTVLHVAERTFLPRVIASLNLIDYFDSTYIGGASASKTSMLALAPGGFGSLYY